MDFDAIHIKTLIKQNNIDQLILLCEEKGSDVDFILDVIHHILVKKNLLEAILSNPKIDLSAFKIPDKKYEGDDCYEWDLVINPMFCAIQQGKLEQVQIFLKYEFNLEYEDYHGRTALHIAVDVGSLEMVQFLIAKGANKEANGCGQTPLAMAAASNNLKLVDYLCSVGCDINVLDFNLISPLGHAVTLGSFRIVQKLLLYGADTHITTSEGDTLVNIAAEDGYPKILELLLQYSY